MKTAAAIVMALAIALAGCSSARDEVPPPPRKVGLRWDQFPDIPIPAGWQAVPGEDHVATAIGNGAARRLHAAMIAPDSKADLQPSDAMTRYVGTVLNETGWTRDGQGRAADLEQRWRKGGETLHISADREGGLVVLRYQLSGTP